MSAKTKKKSVFKTIMKVLLTIIIIALIAAFIVGYYITSKEMDKKFYRVEYPDASLDPDYHYDHYKDKYPREEVSFRSGDNVLKGYIYGLNNDKGVIVFGHGVSHGHERYLSTINALVDCGWRVFTYDCTGTCTSEGKSTVGLGQSVIDMDRALNFVEDNGIFKDMPVFVLGHSWGGYASAAILGFDHDITASCSISGYNKPLTELCEFADRKFGEKSIAIYPFIWLYNQVQFGRYASISAVDSINKTDTPVLIIHGDNDETIEYNGASIIAQRGHITNPNVEYFTFEAQDKDTHSGMFKTSEYYDHYNADLKPRDTELKAKYSDDIPDDVYAEYVASINKDLYNAPNPDLIELIDSFFEKQLTAETAE